jgi:hypothetical protein
VPSPPQQHYAAPSQGHAPPSYSAPAGLGGGQMGGGAGSEVEVLDGSRAIEVQTVFRGVVTGTRHLFNPEGKSTHSQGTTMLYAGLAAAFIGVAMFIATALDVGAEKNAFEDWTNSGKEAKTFPWKSRSPVPGVVVFGGIAAGLALAYMGL